MTKFPPWFFILYYIEFRETIKMLFTVLKYLYKFRRYLVFEKRVKYANETTDDLIEQNSMDSDLYDSYRIKSRELHSALSEIGH